MNKWEWDIIQRDVERSREFEFIREVHPGAPADLTPKTVEAPKIESDPLECPLCGFIGKNDRSLQMHKKIKHQ